MYFNSNAANMRLKHVYSVISVKIHSLRDNTENRESTRSWLIRVRFLDPWVAYGKIIRNLLGALTPPRFDIVDQIWTVLFEKEPWKVKPPLKAPKKSRDFENSLGFSSPTELNSSRENTWITPTFTITWKRSLILKTCCVLKIFSKPRRVKNGPATGVRPVAGSIFWPLSQTHISKQVFMDEISISALPDIQLKLLCVCGMDSFLPELEHLFLFFLSWVSKTQPNHWTTRMANTRLAT